VEVVVAELPAIRSDEPRVRGILGQSALSRLEYTIDHARRRLIVHRPAAARAEEMPEPGALQAQPVAAPRPLVEARLDCGGASVRLVLDSGVEAPVLFEGGPGRCASWFGRRRRPRAPRTGCCRAASSPACGSARRGRCSRSIPGRFLG
jgi:hypothetical protein